MATITSTNTKIDKKDQVTYRHPQYEKLLPPLNFVSDIWEGKAAWMSDDLKKIDYDKAALYLPPTVGEIQDMKVQGGSKGQSYYYNRLRRSRFPRFFRNVIEKDFAGLLSEFELINPHPSIAANIDNIDLLGNSLEVFLKECDQLALRDGACFVFVENPPADPNLITFLDEQMSDRRPYLIPIKRKNVINWQLYNNELVLIVIQEEFLEPSGLFGLNKVDQYRVFRKIGGIVCCQIWRRGEEEDIYYPVEELIIDFPHIPIVPYSLHCRSVWDNFDLPLKDLAEANLRWYQLDSEVSEMIHYCQPTLIKKPDDAIRGSSGNDEPLNLKNKDVPVGARSCLEGEYSWLEPSGTGIQPAQNERQKIEEEIKAHTLSFLQGSQSPKTATQSLLEAAQGQTNLKLMAKFKENAAEVIFRYWALWLNSNEGGKIEVNKQLIEEQNVVNGTTNRTD